MKKHSLRIISVLLCLALLFGAAAPAVFSLDTAHLTNVPMIYIRGQGLDLGIKQENGTWDKVYPLTVPNGFVRSMLTADKITNFIKCYYTNNYDWFCDALYEDLKTIFEDFKLDNTGKAANGSTVISDWHKTLTRTTVDGKYPVDKFAFTYDFRLDPYEVADELNEYIEAVCELTGYEKVAVLGRCLGANEILAYIDKYGNDRFSDIILYASALEGCVEVSHLFNGDVYVDNNGTVRFVDDYDINKYINDEQITEFIRAFLHTYNAVGGVKLALNEVNRVYKLVCDNVVPRILRDSYGTMPGYWAMVEDECYDSAKKLVFGGVEGEWSELIAKLDNYHNNVALKSEEILQQCADDGINVYNIEKYGFAVFPVVMDTEMVCDSTVNLTLASEGATTAKSFKKPFDKDYMAKAEKNGTAKYISPDRLVDASTCMFPDNTWFVKNLRHKTFPDSMNALVCEMINAEGTYTVFDSAEWPQYMVYDEETETASPMTEENCNTTDRWKTNFFKNLIIVFKNIGYVLKKLFG